MLKQSFQSLVISLLIFISTNSHAVLNAHKEAEELLRLSNYDSTMNAQVAKVLEMQSSMRPDLAAFKVPMKQFFEKYMGYEALKPFLIEIYVETFSAEELRELNKFYQSPVGKKAIETIPILMNKAEALAKNQITAHMYELDQMIKEYIKNNPEKVSRSITLAMIKKLNLTAFLFDASYRYSKTSQYYQFMKAKIGEENTEKIIKEELYKVLPEHQEDWVSSLASAIEKYMSKQQISDLATEGNESVYHETFTMKADEIFDLLSKNTDGLIEKISNKAMDSAYYERSN